MNTIKYLLGLVLLMLILLQVGCKPKEPELTADAILKFDANGSTSNVRVNIYPSEVFFLPTIVEESPDMSNEPIDDLARLDSVQLANIGELPLTMLIDQKVVFPPPIREVTTRANGEAIVEDLIPGNYVYLFNADFEWDNPQWQDAMPDFSTLRTGTFQVTGTQVRTYSIWIEDWN